MRYTMVYTTVAKTTIPAASGTDVAGEGMVAMLDFRKLAGGVGTRVRGPPWQIPYTCTVVGLVQPATLPPAVLLYLSLSRMRRQLGVSFHVPCHSHVRLRAARTATSPASAIPYKPAGTM